MLQRKISSASISGAIFAIILGFVMPNPFGEQVVAEQNYLFSSTIIINYYLMFSFPVILLYGVIASIVSDKVAMYVSKKNGNKKMEMIVSGVLHIAFGLVFLPYSLGAAVLFYVTDKLLQHRNRTFNYLQAIKSLIIPFMIWMISLGVVWIEHFIINS